MAAVKLPPVDAVLVAYSGGKDSLATLDMCLRAGKRVEVFFMHFLPGMDYSEHWCSYAERHFRVKVHRVQHPILSFYLRGGVFCDPVDVPAISAKDVEAAVRERTGLDWVGYGYKLADSPSRRSYLTFMSDWSDGGMCHKLRRFSPIMTWKDRDVFSYLSRRRIAIPAMSERKVNGIALLPDVLRDVREQFPEDYRRILKVFPYAAGQADRVGLVKEQKAEWRKTNRAARGAAKARTAAGSPVANQPAPSTMETATQ